MNKNKIKKGFSKKLLIADYIIALIMIAIFLICSILNGLYVKNATLDFLEIGVEASLSTLPFDLGSFGVLLSVWITQLGVSSAAYYVMARSEHRIELPMRLINDLPQEIKDNVDMTQIITTVLTSADN